MPVVRNKFKTIHKQSDRENNFFIVEEEPRYGNWKVYIHLHGEERRRLIGEIDSQNKVMFVKRDKAKHFHREMRSYGFNYKAIHIIGNLKGILMMEQDGDTITYYKIPLKFIQDHGVVKEFSKTGFEIQVFLRIEYFAQLKWNGRFEKGRLKIQGDGE